MAVRSLVRTKDGTQAGQETRLTVFDAPESSRALSLRAPFLVYYGVLSGGLALQADGEAHEEVEAGRSFLVPPFQSLRARLDNRSGAPTRWFALQIDRRHVEEVIDRLGPDPGPPGTGRGPTDQPYHPVDGDAGIQKILRLIAFLFDENPPDRDLLIDLNVKQLIVRLLRSSARPLLVNGHSRHTAEGGLAAAVQYIQNHLDRHISIDELVEEACMSKSSFYRHFSDEFDMSPLEYITEERVLRARELLSDPQMTVADVSHALGFSSTSYFIDMFKEHEGRTPKQYQLDGLDGGDAT
ncbi:MAG: AraC family transcriptional regulator [Salinibacter sp.]